MNNPKVYNKIPENNELPTIGTHSGSFHCDEALACSMLLKTKKFNNAIIIRTRDPEILKDCDILVDVGGVYDKSKLRFDHHQRGFNQTFSDKFKTKLSSAGLVYKHYGKEIIVSSIGQKLTDKELDIVYNYIYKQFIEHIDAHDNGIVVSDGKLKYNISTTLSLYVRNRNPIWTDTNPDYNGPFWNCVRFTGTQLVGTIIRNILGWLPARKIVEEAFSPGFVMNIFDGSHVVVPKGSIYLNQWCPFTSHIYDIEIEKGIEGEILYVIFPENQGESFRVTAVNERGEQFKQRKSLPEAWRGLKDKELDKMVGIDGCTFVHHNGFTGGNKTFKGAVEMVKLALKNVSIVKKRKRVGSYCSACKRKYDD